jgi:hypothetical protein
LWGAVGRLGRSACQQRPRAVPGMRPARCKHASAAVWPLAVAPFAQAATVRNWWVMDG